VGLTIPRCGRASAIGGTFGNRNTMVSLIKYVALGIAARVAYKYVKHTQRMARTSEEAELLSHQLVGLLDVVEEDPSEFLDEQWDGEAPAKVKSGAMLRCAVATALLIRAKNLYLTRSKENRNMVVTAAVRLLELRNVRKSDIARLLPIIVVAVFVPMREDLLAAQLSGTDRIAQEVYRAERRYQTGGFVRWLTNRWVKGTRLEWTE